LIRESRVPASSSVALRISIVMRETSVIREG
jgi:hypothetical protein